MTDTTFTFRVDSDLKARFTTVAAAQDRTAAQLLRVLMRRAVEDWHESQEHDAWFRSEVERAIIEADDPGVVRTPNDQVQSSWRQQRAALERRTAGRPA